MKYKESVPDRTKITDGFGTTGVHIYHICIYIPCVVTCDIFRFCYFYFNIIIIEWKDCLLITCFFLFNNKYRKKYPRYAHSLFQNLNLKKIIFKIIQHNFLFSYIFIFFVFFFYIYTKFIIKKNYSSFYVCNYSTLAYNYNKEYQNFIHNLFTLFTHHRLLFKCTIL